MDELELLDKKIKTLENRRDVILIALDDLYLEWAYRFCDFDVGDTVTGDVIGRATAIVEEITHRRGSPVVLLTVTSVKDARRKFSSTVVGDMDAATLKV